MEEIWKVYKDKRSKGRGWFNCALWEVSNLGRAKKDGILINTPLHKGYLYIGRWLIHRAVAEVFIPNPENKPCVDHIDGNKLNNRVDNLRWVTYSENMRNPITQKKLSRSRKGKLPWSTGKHLSEETKHKLSDSLKGKNKGKHWYKDPITGKRIYYE